MIFAIIKPLATRIHLNQYTHTALICQSCGSRKDRKNRLVPENCGLMDMQKIDSGVRLCVPPGKKNEKERRD